MHKTKPGFVAVREADGKTIMEKEARWVFFDIDGTLLYARGAGQIAFRNAFREALGWDQGVDHINFYGATDLDVFRRIAAERGVQSTPAMEQSFFERLATELDLRLRENPPEVFPNVIPLLAVLSRDWHLGVVTGNVEATARLKLRHAGLLDFFDPRGFGCGCDHADRIEIARLALARAGNPRRAALVGDTPKDIAAARANGMLSIAVATGGFDAPALHAANADFVFNDLSATEQILEILEAL